MKLKFDLKDKKNINIINEEDGRIVGRIFTPSGTIKDKSDSIQICGFSRAFELWSCGVMGDNKGHPLQDIQLLFKDFKSKTGQDMKGISFGAKNLSLLNKDGCDRCFYKKDDFGNCKCSELKVHKRYENIKKWENRRKNYETKEKIIKKIKNLK